MIILVLASLHACGSSSGSRSESEELGGPVVAPEEGVLLGAFAPEAPEDFNADTTTSSIQRLDEKFGKSLSVVELFVDMSDEAGNWIPFPEEEVGLIADLGAIPLISWSGYLFGAVPNGSGYPVWEATGAGEDSRDALLSLPYLAAGEADDYLREWAQAAQDLGTPLIVRWGWEMNGDWWPWGGPANHDYASGQGLTGSELYRQVFEHLRDIFREVGASNVAFMWSPNDWSYPQSEDNPGEAADDWNTYDAYWPGGDDVDWIGLTVYNWPSNNAGQEETFAERAEDVVTTLSDYNKPVCIAEMGAEAGTDQGMWWSETFALLKTDAYAMVRCIVQMETFSFSTEPPTDFQIAADALSSFQAELDNDYLIGRE